MIYAVISDLHANLQALDAVLADARTQGAERVVCLGDVVGYGPLPSETLARLRTVAATVLAGNHDDAVAGRGGIDDFIDLAADAARRHREALSAEDLAFLGSLPYTGKIEGAELAHGDFTAPEQFNYIDSADAAGANFAASDSPLLFVGHTHVPLIHLTGASGTVYEIPPQDFTLEEGKRYIVNPGSVGYPRESGGKCLSSYVLYDSGERTICFRFLPFTVSSVMQRGVGSGRFAKKKILPLLGGVALVSAALACFLVPSKEVETVREITKVETAYTDDPALEMSRRTLTLPKKAKSVQAGLKISRAAPVSLRVVFLDSAGAVLGSNETDVKESGNKRISVPPDAVSAEFTVRKTSLSDSPEILAFEPCWR